jgi:hypothetical protein
MVSIYGYVLGYSEYAQDISPVKITSYFLVIIGVYLIRKTSKKNLQIAQKKHKKTEKSVFGFNIFFNNTSYSSVFLNVIGTATIVSAQPIFSVMSSSNNIENASIFVSDLDTNPVTRTTSSSIL